MFTSRFALVVFATAALVSIGLVGLLDAAPVTALFAGLGAGVLAAVMPAAVSDGRFPGGRTGRRATVVASLVILGSALVAPAALSVDGPTRLSVSLLVLLTGYAAFMLGSAAVIEDSDDSVAAPAGREMGRR